MADFNKKIASALWDLFDVSFSRKPGAKVKCHPSSDFLGYWDIDFSLKLAGYQHAPRVDDRGRVLETYRPGLLPLVLLKDATIKRFFGKADAKPLHVDVAREQYTRKDGKEGYASQYVLRSTEIRAIIEMAAQQNAGVQAAIAEATRERSTPAAAPAPAPAPSDAMIAAVVAALAAGQIKLPGMFDRGTPAAEAPAPQASAPGNPFDTAA